MKTEVRDLLVTFMKKQKKMKIEVTRAGLENKVVTPKGSLGSKKTRPYLVTPHNPSLFG